MNALLKIDGTSFGQIMIGRHTYETDVYILVNGEIKKRKKKLAKEIYGTSHKIGACELKKICKGRPKKVFIGTGQSGEAELTQDGQEYLHEHAIDLCVQTTPQVVEEYNKYRELKAALIHVTS
jgi:hypothetical protein